MHIHEIDGGTVTQNDIDEIYKQVCINCYKKYDGIQEIFFVSFDNRELTWWHKQHKEIYQNTIRTGL